MSTLDIKKVRRRRIYQELVDQLADLIVSGKAPPGTTLPSERELVERFGVGRSSVREALFALQKMGLIELNNGERASVIAPTSAALVDELTGSVRYYLSQPSGMREFQGAREFLEVGLVRHAALHADAAQLTSIKVALDANRETLGNVERFVETDIAFHLAIAEVANNPIFATLHSAVLSWLRDQRAIGVRVQGSPENAVKAHARIFDAISKKDPDAAERQMRKHLKQVVDYYWAGI